MRISSLHTILFFSFSFTTFQAWSQSVAADFENFSLSANSHYTGADQSNGFTSGYSYFHNKYDTSFGGFWAEGWIYSNLEDSVTPGYGNLYSARTAGGYNSATYAIGQQDSRIRFSSQLKNDVHGIYISNSTYTALSMRDGDSFAKKFGGSTGNDPDWLKLSIIGYADGLINDTVDVYLADYRFADNSQDYILNTWKYVDLNSLGYVDSLKFHLSSSDNGSWGMNTPAFFAIDDFSSTDPSGINSNESSELFSLYPNPASDFIIIETGYPMNITIKDLNGKTILNHNTNLTSNIDISFLAAGCYYIQAIGSNNIIVRKFIKQ